MTPELPVLAVLATALDDSAPESDRRHALQRAIEFPWETIQQHRLAPALALRAKAAGLEPPAPWQRALLGTTAHLLRLQHAAEQVMSILGELGIPWTVLKGFDLGPRIYGRAEERPTSDLDFLVAPEHRTAAVAALQAGGWQKLFPGHRYAAYLRDEGYADSLTLGPQSGTLLEIHFRLWGLLPERAGRDVLDAAVDDPALGPGGRRVTLAAAWVIAAIHVWLDPPPRPLRAWWELRRLSVVAREEGLDLLAEVLPLVEAWGAQLPTLLAAAQTAALWPSDATNRTIADTLSGHLRWPERLLARRVYPEREATTGTIAALSTAQIVRSRLLALRPSRAGWRTLPRQLWAHPGIVEIQTPEDTRWPRRRWRHVRQQLRHWLP